MRKLKNQHIRYIETPDTEGGAGGEEREITDPRHPNFKDSMWNQDQIEHFMTREKAQGKRAGAREWAEKLTNNFKAHGFPEDAKIEDILALAASKRDADEALKSEAEKALDAANARQAELDAQLAAAKADRFDAKLERLLTESSNVKVAKASLTAYGVTVESTDDELKTAIASLKSDAPGLFGTAKPAPNTDPHTPTGNGAGKTAKDRAREYAEKRNWRQPAA